jgi:hypothetical protein
MDFGHADSFSLALPGHPYNPAEIDPVKKNERLRPAFPVVK